MWLSYVKQLNWAGSEQIVVIKRDLTTSEKDTRM